MLEEALRENVGDITFREAYLRSGKVINITVCSAGGERPRLLNYLTAPNVLCKFFSFLFQFLNLFLSPF